jgi:hypothetical protein
MKPPKLLNKIVDVVLNYRPEAKQKQPKKRSKKAKPQTDDSKVKRESST